MSWRSCNILILYSVYLYIQNSNNRHIGCIVLFTGWFHWCIRLEHSNAGLMHRWNQPVNKTTHPLLMLTQCRQSSIARQTWHGSLNWMYADDYNVIKDWESWFDLSLSDDDTNQTPSRQDRQLGSWGQSCRTKLYSTSSNKTQQLQCL